jgi:hypothetical protein
MHCGAGNENYAQELIAMLECSEWESRKAAGLTVGGAQYRAMLDDVLRKYLPK